MAEDLLPGFCRMYGNEPPHYSGLKRLEFQGLELFDIDALWFFFV